MSGTEATRLLLFDGNNLVQRSYWAMAGASLHDSQNRPTGALYGTIKAFLGTLKELHPTHCLWLFDDGKSDMRTALRPDYKGHRKYSATATGDPRVELPPQFDALRAFFSEISVAHWSQRGVEADDLIAHVVKSLRWPEKVDETIIISGDHDMMQLVSTVPLVKVHKPGDRIEDKRGAVGLGNREKPLKLNDVSDVIAKYELPPYQLPEMWALTGDTGDNIAGIPGVGPKTAAKWMRKHGSLPMVLASEPKCEGYERKCAVNLELIELDGRVGRVGFELEDVVLNKALERGVLPWEAEQFLSQYDMQSLIKEGV